MTTGCTKTGTSGVVQVAVLQPAAINHEPTQYMLCPSHPNALLHPAREYFDPVGLCKSIFSLGSTSRQGIQSAFQELAFLLAIRLPPPLIV